MNRPARVTVATPLLDDMRELMREQALSDGRPGYVRKRAEVDVVANRDRLRC
jgi:hypothetical protein